MKFLLTLEFIQDEDVEDSLASRISELFILCLKTFFTRFCTLIILLRKLFFLSKGVACLVEKFVLSYCDKFLCCKFSALVQLILDIEEDRRSIFKYLKRDNQFFDL